jgi:thioredoxin reductase
MNTYSLTATVVLSFILFARIYAETDFVQYLIVGAGPAGLQYGAFLEAKGRSYRILERGPSVCTFWDTFPRHRNLISLNKRYTGRQDPEFNLRHDWNSFLDAGKPGSPLFRDFSTRAFPTADEMSKYCHAFNSFHNLKIEHNRTIVRVKRKTKTNPNFMAPQHNFTVFDQNGRKTKCEILIWATSRAPYLPNMEGIEHSISYDSPNFSTDPEFYTNKRVLILGLGNAAFETAQAIKDYAGVTNLIGRNYGGLRFAYNTHYVGDIRAVNAHVTDTFLLKSLDTIDPGFDLTNGWLEKNATTGQIRLRFKGDRVNLNYRDPFDVVISCLGWRFNPTPFDDNIRPNVIMDGKYPETTAEYESKNVPNLFFAGTLMHGLDFRKAAGGFIHGFRYLIRAQHRFLEVRNHEGNFFNENSVISPVTPATVAAALHRRIQTSSGLYQMFNVLCDIVVWDQRYNDGNSADYVEERPCADITSQSSHRDTPLFSLTFDYGHGMNGRADNSVVTLYPGRAHQAQFLHPVLRFYRPKLDPTRGDLELTDFELLSEFHVNEDFVASWDVEEFHRKPIEDWIVRVMNNNFITQAEILEQFAQEAYHNLTETQKISGATVFDRFYGEFVFPSRAEISEMVSKGQLQVADSNVVADKKPMPKAGNAAAVPKKPLTLEEAMQMADEHNSKLDL